MTGRLDSDDPLAVEVVRTIRAGELATLRRLLAEHPGLATTRIADPSGNERTLERLLAEKW